MSTKRINLISGPRNISTALMYSFGNRSDTSVVDEPMYAYYLANTDVDHPGKNEIMNSLPHDLESVKKTLLFRQVETPYYFIKGMAHHFISDDLDFILGFENIFLIRDPKKLIYSFSKVIKQPTLNDIGIKREYEIYQYITSRDNGCVIVDSGELLKSPKGVLQKMCAFINIPYSEEMLRWKPGQRKEDGVWAKHWYSNVHKTSGFEKNITKDVSLPSYLKPLYDEAMPYYERLFEKSIKG